MIATISFFLSAVLIQAAQELVPVAEYESPRRVYGPAHSIANPLSKNTDVYRAMRASADCNFPIDFLFLQDITGGHHTNFEGVATETLPTFGELISAEHPGSSFSLASFKDKPINELGELGDYCLQLEVSAASNVTAFTDFYMSTVANGGWDWPENQFGALVEAVMSPTNYPWMQNDIATRIVILITDSAPHYEGDAYETRYPQLTPWGDDIFDERRSESYCRERYYPSPSTVVQAFKNNNVYLAQIIVDPEAYNSVALDAAMYLNTLLAQDECFVTGTTDNTWLNELTSIVEALNTAECGSLSTTEPSDTDSVETGTLNADTLPAESVEVPDSLLTDLVEPLTLDI